jgi:hypothetical protein
MDERRQSSGNTQRDADGEDHVWRFRLDGDKAAAQESDPLVEMIRVYLADLLQIAFLTKDGRRIEADGFAFVAEPDVTHRIFPEKE